MADDIDWSRLNQPFGSLQPAQYTPTQRLTNATQDVLQTAGAQPFAARHLAEGLGDIANMTPLGAIGSAANLGSAASRGNIGDAMQASLGLFPAARSPAAAALKSEAGKVFPIIESERERRFRTGFDSFARVDAGALKQSLEESLGQPLAWSKDKLDALREKGYADAYPRLSVEKGRLGIHDGRHRIATAAERGEAIDVVTETPEEAEHLEKRYPVEAPQTRARGGRAFAAGGSPAPADDWITPAADDVATAPADDWVTPAAADTSESADHGLSERQKLSTLGKAINPVTSYPETYNRMNLEAQHQMARGVGQLTKPESALDLAYGAGNIGFGGLNYIASPINAAYRSVIGQPVEDVTGIPREWTEFAAQLATPGIGLTRPPKAPGVAPEAPPMRPPMSAEAGRAEELGNEFGINYSRGQSETDLDRIRYEDMAARGAHGPEAQQRASGFFDRQFQDIQNAGRDVGEKFATGEQPLGTPADAGASLNTVIGDKATEARAVRDKALQDAEQARTQQKTQADETLAQQREQAEQGVARQRQLANERAQSITEGVAGRHQTIESARDAGEAVGQGIRDAATENRNQFRSLYNEFGQMEGSLPLDAVQGMGTRLRDDLSLSDHPVVIDDHLTPAASRAIQMLDEMSSRPSIPNRASPRMPMPADAEIAGVNLQGIDRMRRHLVAFYKTTQRGSEDQRAVRAIMSSFDGQVENAITSGLFSGDPRALEVLQNARASYARYRQMFGPTRPGDDVGLAMQRIVDRHATPEEIANMVVGSGKLGNAGLPVRIADRLENVLGADSPEFNSVRQAIWQKASQVRNAAGEVDHLKSANGIRDFVGSTLARRMFAPDELAAMRSHSEGLRSLQAVSDSLPASQKAATAAHAQATKGAEAAFTEAAGKAHGAYEAAFGGGELTGQQRGVFQRMAEGTATPEETANAFFSIIGGGNPGHAVRALDSIERIVGRDSPVMGAIRQGVWQKLTQHPFGKDQPGQQKLVQSLNEFLNGKGKTIASRLYSDEERALMRRYSEAVQRTIIPKYARTNSDTAPALLNAAQRNAGKLGAMVGGLLGHGPVGATVGYGVGKMIDSAVGGAGNLRTMRKLDESFNPPQAVRPRRVIVSSPRMPIVPLANATGGNEQGRAAGGRTPFHQPMTNPFSQ